MDTSWAKCTLICFQRPCQSSSESRTAEKEEILGGLPSTTLFFFSVRNFDRRLTGMWCQERTQAIGYTLGHEMGTTIFSHLWSRSSKQDHCLCASEPPLSSWFSNSFQQNQPPHSMEWRYWGWPLWGWPILSTNNHSNLPSSWPSNVPSDLPSSGPTNNEGTIDRLELTSLICRRPEDQYSSNHRRSTKKEKEK